MNTCSACGHETHAASTFQLYPDGVVVGDGLIPLTRTELTILKILQGAMQRGPVSNDNIIAALYNLGADEPETAIDLLRVFIHRLRKKLESTNLSIVNHYGFGYSLDYESWEAA